MCCMLLFSCPILKFYFYLFVFSVCVCVGCRVIHQLAIAHHAVCTVPLLCAPLTL